MQPWIGLLWRRRVGELAARHANRALLLALQQQADLARFQRNRLLRLLFPEQGRMTQQQRQGGLTLQLGEAAAIRQLMGTLKQADHQPVLRAQPVPLRSLIEQTPQRQHAATAPASTFRLLDAGSEADAGFIGQNTPGQALGRGGLHWREQENSAGYCA